MSITEELRMYVQDWRDTPSLMDGLDRGDMDGILEDFIRIADRIDAEHAVKVERLEKYRAAVDAMLKEYVKLPVDADGVPIHVGDELTNGINLPAKVRGMALGEDGWIVSSASFGGTRVDQSTLRHVKPDSWESIMDDAEKLARCDNAAVIELVERCRRLAGEAG